MVRHESKIEECVSFETIVIKDESNRRFLPEDLLINILIKSDAVIKLAGTATVDLSKYLNMSVLSSELETIPLLQSPDKKAQILISIELEKVADGLPLNADQLDASVSQEISLLKTLGGDTSLRKDQAIYSRFENSQHRGKSRSNSRNAIKIGKASDEIGKIFDDCNIPPIENMMDIPDPLNLTSLNEGSKLGSSFTNPPSTSINYRTNIIKARDLLFKDTDEGELGDRSIARGRSPNQSKSIDKRSRSNVKINLKKRDESTPRVENAPPLPQTVQPSQHSDIIRKDTGKGYIDPFEVKNPQIIPDPQESKLLELRKQVTTSQGSHQDLTQSLTNSQKFGSSLKIGTSSNTPSYLQMKQATGASNDNLNSIFDVDNRAAPIQVIRGLPQNKLGESTHSYHNPAVVPTITIAQPATPYQQFVSPPLGLQPESRKPEVISRQSKASERETPVINDSGISFGGSAFHKKQPRVYIDESELDGVPPYLKSQQKDPQNNKDRVALERLQADLNSALGRIVVLESTNAKLEADNSQLNFTANELRRSLQDQDAATAALQKQLTESAVRYRESHEASQATIRGLEDQLKKQEIALLRDLDLKADRENDRVAELERRCEGLQHKLDEATAVHSKCEARVKEVERKSTESSGGLTRKMQELEMSLQAKDNQLRNLEKELKVRHEVASKEDSKVDFLEAKCEDLESELRAAKSKIEELQAERLKSSGRLESSNHAQSIKEMNTKFQEVNFKYEQANLRIIDLEDANTDLLESIKALVNCDNVERRTS